MTPQRWETLSEVFERALQLPPAERDAFLAQACAGDEELRREVAAMLAAEEADPEYLNDGALNEYAEEIVAGLAPLQPGQKLGKYEIVALLGTGGMGEVWEAKDLELQRTVAIKILPLEVVADPERLKQFRQEAVALSGLDHAHIVTVYDIGQQETLHYIVMEYVVGQTLRERLRTGQLPPAEAIDIAAQIADALAAAHKANIIHCDIKPENVMCRADGNVKVLDFSIAKLTATGSGGKTKGGAHQPPDETTELRNFSTVHYSTALGTIEGTISYMSPEQAQGQPLDGRTDVFSLGLVLFEMVTGKGLLAGQEPDTILQCLRSEREPLAAEYKFDGVARPLENMIRKSLKRDRNARYATAQQMLDELKTLQRQAATQKFRRLAAVAGAIAVAALLFALIAARLSITETWREQILRDGHTSLVKRAIFFPDGKRLVSVSEDKQIIVWDFVQRKRIKTLTAHTGWVNSVDFSPDGKYFATGSSDKTVIVWDAETLEPVITLREFQAPVHSVAFSPNGKVFAAAVYDDVGDDKSKSRTFLWNVEGWKKLWELPEGRPYGNLLFSPDSRLLLTARIQWDIATGQRVNSERDEFGGNWCEFSPDAKAILCMGGGGEVDTRTLAAPGRLGNYKAKPKYPAHQDFGRTMAFSSDRKLLATGTDNVVIWDAATMQIQGRFDAGSSVWSLAFSPDGRNLVSSHGDGSIHVWDMAQRRREFSFHAHADIVRAVAVSPDGKRYATAGDDRSIILWNAETGRKDAVLQGHTYRIINLVFAPNGKWLASLGQDGVLIRWDLARGQAVWTAKHVYEPSLTVSPDGKWLVTKGCRINSDNGEKTFFFDAKDSPAIAFSDVAFTAQGNHLVATSGNLALVIDPQNWRIQAQQQDGNSVMDTLSVSPDGSHFVTGKLDGSVELWDVNPLRKRDLLGKHSGRVGAVRFAPDGQTVVSTGADKTIRHWDVNGWRQPQTIGTHALPVAALAFSPDGKRLLTGEQDRTVRVYTRHRELWGRESQWLDLFF